MRQKFQLGWMGGQAAGLAFTDQVARTPIGASRNSSNVVGNLMSIKILMEIYLHIASYEDLLTGFTDLLLYDMVVNGIIKGGVSGQIE